MTHTPPLRVVGAAIISDGTVLACRRRPEKSAGGLWEFPGGKVEPGESPQVALARELREELEVAVRVGDEIARATTTVEGRSVDLAVLEARLVGAPPERSSDHDAMVWCDAEQLDARRWSPADVPLVPVVAQVLLGQSADRR